MSSGAQPSFLQTGGTSENAELHSFLYANYRAIIVGKIGKTRDIAERAFDGAYLTLQNASEAICAQHVGTSLSNQQSIDQLKSSLQLADINRARRIFNAMLLGDAPHSGGQWGTPFKPMHFGRKSIEYSIDHLLPQSNKLPASNGAKEVETIKNFAPLRTNQNSLAKATNCSSKLGVAGVYENAITIATTQHEIVHPYWQWLTQTQGSLGADLDNQALLIPNSSPDIGTDRIQWLADFLIKKV